MNKGHPIIGWPFIYFCGDFDCSDWVCLVFFRGIFLVGFVFCLVLVCFGCGVIGVL